MKATIIDVAREAGVSISTVSNALTGRKNVSPELRDRISAAVERLGYTVDQAASSLKSRSSRVIGLIVPSIDSAFFPAVIKGLQGVLEAAGYMINFYSTSFCPELESKYVNTLVSNRADGILIDSVSTDETFLRSLASKSCGGKPVPVIALERDLSKHRLTSVFFDNLRGGRLAAEVLYQNGVRKPAHILGPDSAPWSKDRYLGFRQGFAEHGISPILVEQGDFSLRGGYLAGKRLLDCTLPFDGLFASNDLTAVGAIRAFQEAELAIPDAVRVVGFDNIAVSSLISPSLTTVNVPKEQLGQEAGQAVLAAIDGEPGGNRIELPLAVVERKSTNGPDTGAEWM